MFKTTVYHAAPKIAQDICFNLPSTRCVCFKSESSEICYQVGFSLAKQEAQTTENRSSGMIYLCCIWASVRITHISDGLCALCRSNILYYRNWVRIDWVLELNGIHMPLRLNKPVLQPSQQACCCLKNRFVFQTCYFPAWLIMTSCLTKQKQTQKATMVYLIQA